MRVILAGPEKDGLVQEVYPAFAVSGLEVEGLAETPEELADVAAALPDSVAVVQADLYPSPEEAAEGLKALSCQVAVVLPRWWEGEQGHFAGLPNLIVGFTGPVSWAQVAGEVKAWGRAVVGGRAVQGVLPPLTEGSSPPLLPCPSSPRPDRLSAGTAGAGRVVALWSGPAGGTGRTALALLLAAYAAEQGLSSLLLAFSEPGLSAYLGLARTPNVTTFFEGGDLWSAMQSVSWDDPEGRVRLTVVLGPARPRDGKVEPERIGDLVEAARACNGLIVVDLPPLVPGGNPWSLEPLRRVSDVVLVAVPTAAGVVAVVEGLATLRDLHAPGRVHLALNQRTPGGGLTPRGFIQAVVSLWGDCPSLAVEVPYVPDLTAALDRGELPESPALIKAVGALAKAAAGISRSEPKRGKERREKPAPNGTGRPKRRPGRLITVEVVD